MTSNANDLSTDGLRRARTTEIVAAAAAAAGSSAHDVKVPLMPVCCSTPRQMQCLETIPVVSDLRRNVDGRLWPVTAATLQEKNSDVHVEFTELRPQSIHCRQSWAWLAGTTMYSRNSQIKMTKVSALWSCYTDWEWLENSNITTHDIMRHHNSVAVKQAFTVVAQCSS